jgi:hypothetical protein
LTSYLTGSDQSVLQIKTKIVSCHTADSKPVKQEVNGTMILPPFVFLDTANVLTIEKTFTAAAGSTQDATAGTTRDATPTRRKRRPRRVTRRDISKSSGKNTNLVYSFWSQCYKTFFLHH